MKKQDWEKIILNIKTSDSGEILTDSTLFVKTKVNKSGQIVLTCFPLVITEEEKIEYAKMRIEQIKEDFDVKMFLKEIQVDYTKGIVSLWKYEYEEKMQAECSRSDTFSFDIGLYLALSRRLNLEINPSYFM